MEKTARIDDQGGLFLRRLWAQHAGTRLDLLSPDRPQQNNLVKIFAGGAKCST